MEKTYVIERFDENGYVRFSRKNVGSDYEKALEILKSDMAGAIGCRYELRVIYYT